MVDSALPLPELWRLRTPSNLVRGVALLKDGGDTGVTTLAELRAPGVPAIDGLAEILFPTGLPSQPRGFSTVMTDSFTHRTYVGVQISYSTQAGEGSCPLATCAWSHLPEVAAPRFLKMMEAIQVHLSNGDPSSFAQLWSWLVNAVPAPPPGTALILHGLTEALCVVSRPPPAGLPAVYVPLQHLLTRLSVSSILLVTRLVLLEQKVLFVGSSVAMLTSACEAFSTILFFPLAWVHCYNPLLPCTDYLQTPPPFLFGCLREIILKETGADSQDLLSSELLGPKSLGLAGESRDFSIVDLDTGDVYLHDGEGELPALPDAAQSRLRFSFTELRAQLEARQDVWPATEQETTEELFQNSVQKIYLTFMADLLGDVAGSLGPPCETATAASVLSSFQEGHFLSSVSAKDKPFFESFVQSHAFLAYLQTLHLFGTAESPFAEALRSLGHRRRKPARFALPEAVASRLSSGGSTGGAWQKQGAMILACDQHQETGNGSDGNHGIQQAVLELHLRCPAGAKWPPSQPEGKVLLASAVHEVMPKEGSNRSNGSKETLDAAEHENVGHMSGILVALEAAAETFQDDRHLWEKLACDLYQSRTVKGLDVSENHWSLVLLYAVLCRKLGASMEFLLRVHLTIDRPAALPTHSILSLMNGIDSHRLSDILVEAEKAPDSAQDSTDGVDRSNPSVRFARRLLAVANPAALASAEAARDPLAALAFLCPEEGSMVEVVAMDPLDDLAHGPGGGVVEATSPRVEMLPFKGPKETTVLNHRRFCNWTDRSAEVLSAQLVRDVYRAAVAVEKGSSKAYKLLERLSEPLAELQCCSLQGKNHEVRLAFWLNCLNAAALLAALAPIRLGLAERPSDASAWSELLRTAQLEVQGELLSLTDMEQVIRAQNEISVQDPILKEIEDEDSRVSHLQLKRPVPLASFAIHRPTRSGFPPLRIYQAKHLQAQLELNAVHFLCRQMSLDTWRRKVLLPESLKWHLADFGGETQMLEMLGDILKRAPEQVELVGGPLPENLKELSLERHDRLRVEYQEVLWQFQVPETPLETELGETKAMACRAGGDDGDGRLELGQKKWLWVPNGYASLKDVRSASKNYLDRMESFFIAETQKYLLLLQDPDHTLRLDRYVFNTEAHPLTMLDLIQK
eukprot:s659_g13.t1